MQIETYEIEEINSSEASTMAADAEAIELIEKLGLKGQRALIEPETGTRFPYPRLSAQQEAVFSTLFPERSEVGEYRQGIIPLRVLQVVAFCKELPQTKCLEVWHPESVKEDPILVGSPSQFSAERYLLARWGDALPTWEELKAKAAVKAEALLLAEFSKARQQFDGFIQNISTIARAYMETGKKPNWWIHES